MSELDEIVKKNQKGKSKKGGDMKGAVEGTEEIRSWVSHKAQYKFANLQH